MLLIGSKGGRMLGRAALRLRSRADAWSTGHVHGPAEL